MLTLRRYLLILGLVLVSKAFAEPLCDELSERVKITTKKGVVNYNYAANGAVATDFERTNRGLVAIRSVWSGRGISWLNPNFLEGKRVLDFACGDGQLVLDLNKEAKASGDIKFSIVGVDGKLVSNQKRGANRSLFVEADGSLNLPFGENSFDITHSWEGPLSYYSYANSNHRQIIEGIFDQIYRVNTHGAKFLFNVYNGDRYALFERLYSDSRFKILIPQNLTPRTMRNGNGLDGFFVVEIIK